MEYTTDPEYFNTAYGNKCRVTIDLKDKHCLKVALNLLADMDVFVESTKLSQIWEILGITIVPLSQI